MSLLHAVIFGTLTLPTICTAMAQSSAAPAPVAPATADPAQAVSLEEAARGLIEMCTDYVGKPEIPFTEDKIKGSFPQDKIKTLGVALRAGDRGVSFTAPTTDGVMMGMAGASGSCLITPVRVGSWTFAHAFSAALDSSTSYVRGSRLPPSNVTTVTSWRGQKVLAQVFVPQRADQVAVVRISPALE